MRVPYGEKKELFRYSLFLVFCNRLATSAVSAGALLVKRLLLVVLGLCSTLMVCECGFVRRVGKRLILLLRFISTVLFQCLIYSLLHANMRLVLLHLVR